MPLDAEGADSGDAPEEEVEDVSQVSWDQRVPPPLLRDKLQAQAVCWTGGELLLISVYIQE